MTEAASEWVRPATVKRVFISYRSGAHASLVEVIDTLLGGYGTEALYDTKNFSSHSGRDWTIARDKCLQDSELVLLVATADIFEGKALRPAIREELAVARSLGKDIHVLQIADRSLVDTLVDLGECPWIREQLAPGAQSPTWKRSYSDAAQVSPWDRAALFSLVRPNLDDYFQRLAGEARGWADRTLADLGEWLIPEDSASMRACRDLLSAAHAPEGDPARAKLVYAVVAAGGEGKSVLLARAIRAAEERASKVLPILVPMPALIHGGPDALARWLGAESSSTIDEVLRQHRLAGRHLLFIIDALEQFRLDRASPERSNLIPSLKQLAANSAVLVTCRTEAWNVTFSGILSQASTIDIQGQARSGFLRSHPELDSLDSRSPFLFSNALVIDFWLRQRVIHARPPESRQDLLIAMLAETRGPYTLGTTAGPDLQRSQVLTALARIQLRLHTFLASAAEFKRDCDALASPPLPGSQRADDRRALAGILAERADDQVRLRHDILDASNCAQELLRRGRDGILDWLAGIETSDDLQIATALFWLTSDDAAHGRVSRRDVFDGLLRLLDLKSLKESDPPSVWRAWLVTWVLEGLVRDPDTLGITEYALDMMEGEARRASYPSNGPPTLSAPGFDYSSSRDNAGWTVEALSTVASIWKMFPLDRAPNPVRAVPILERLLSRTSRRGRIVEALGKYQTDKSIAALVDVCNAEAAQDPELLTYISRALRPLSGDSSMIREALARVTTSPPAPFAAKRMADLSQPAEGPWKDEELVQVLRIGGRDVDESSDWHSVYEAASQVKQFHNQREMSGGVRSGLADCMYHAHSRAAASAVGALASFHDDAAIVALLERAIRNTLQLDTLVLSALEGALAAEINAAGSRLAGVLRACLVTYAIGIERGHTGSVELLRRLLERNHLDGSCFRLSTPTASLVPELTPMLAVAHLEIGEGDESPLDLSILEFATSEDRQAAGENREDKLRIAHSDGVARLVRTTWITGRSHHRALNQAPPTPEDRHLPDIFKLGFALAPSLFVSRSPGIAVAHVLCLTSDDKLLCAQRPLSASYAPGAWSTSYEEQLMPSDATSDVNPFLAAAMRGFKEEFGLDLARREIQQLEFEAILEHPIMNMAVAICLRLPYSSEQIRAAWSGTPPPTHKHEALALRFVHREASEKEIDQALESQLHPTSGLRIALVRRGKGSVA